ncbi:MAG: TolC family protein [Ferruginibacter sp.]
MRHIIMYMQMLMMVAFANAQTAGRLTIDECYTLSKQNYPLIRQLELIDKTTAYNIQNASKGFLPQIAINGQASYQSAVTEIPIKIPGVNTPEVSKDQYKIYADVNQSIYDGGVIKLQQQSQKTNGEVERQKVEIELYKLKDRINQLFFAVLIIDEQVDQNELLKKDIQLGINKAEAAIANGTALKSTANVLKAEWLKADERTIELKATRKGYIDMLGLFINRPLDENTNLTKPVYTAQSQEINRPELKLYDLQNKSLDVQNKLLKAKNLPKIGLFLQGGYGRPSLNFLSNKFEPYYTTGLKISWPITGSYTTKNDKALVNINRRNIDLQKETFLLNTKLVIHQQDAEIEKFEKLVSTDSAIIDLRTSIKNASLAQLENGVATSNDYLREVNAEDQAKQARILHGLQLLMAQYNNQTTTGN